MPTFTHSPSTQRKVLPPGQIDEPLAMLAAAFWVFNSFVHAAITQYGLETGLLVVAILFLLRRLQDFEARPPAEPVKTKEIALLAAAAVFVFLSRLDMIFLAASRESGGYAIAM